MSLGVARRRHRIAAVAVALGLLGDSAWQGGAQDAEQVFDLRIGGGKVAGGVSSLRVREGDRVRLRWTTDARTVLHLHGYDVEQEVVPGRVAEMRFEAYATGRFPIEVHGADHAHHEAPLMFLEVWPP
jgi:heme/copper-type cytochrome/quinol oxidase subunit 2